MALALRLRLQMTASGHLGDATGSEIHDPGDRLDGRRETLVLRARCPTEADPFGTGVQYPSS